MLTKNIVNELSKRVGEWEHIEIGPHRFGGVEFNVDTAEVGHVHIGGVVDILFSRAIRDQLVTEGLANQHHILPDTGWISFTVRSEEDLEHAVWLLRLSYLQKCVLQLQGFSWDMPAIQAELDILRVSVGLREVLFRRPVPIVG